MAWRSLLAKRCLTTRLPALVTPALPALHSCHADQPAISAFWPWLQTERSLCQTAAAAQLASRGIASQAPAAVQQAVPLSDLAEGSSQAVPVPISASASSASTRRVTEGDEASSSGSGAAAGAAHAGVRAVYRLRVVTGDVRGAGTSAPAVVQLFGEDGESAEFLLGQDTDDFGFEQSSAQAYELSLPRPLGELKRVMVRQVAPGASESGTDWFLDKVEVRAPDGRQYDFPCHSWLGRSDMGDFSGCLERNLVPCEAVGLQEVIQERYLDDPLVVHASGLALPHPEKLAQGGPKAVNRRHLGHGGEDAYFIAAGRNGIYGLGVADGVYMWKTQGINSGLFSAGLMRAAKEAVEAGHNDTLKVLQAAEDAITEHGIKGSSTACIVLIDTLQGRLTSGNLGDSGFLVLGRTPHTERVHLKFRSPQQEHSFGCPYQLGHHATADHAKDAMLMTLPVMPGDVVILGSDGLFDNVSDETLVAETRAALEAGKRPALIAQHLAALAFNASVDRSGVTPYSLAASEAFDMVYSGGKQDDITVVVAYLQ